MKICLINPTEAHRTEVYSVAKFLAKRGHDISILQPYEIRKPETNYNGSVNILPLKCSSVPKISYTLPPFAKQYSILKKLINQGYEIIQSCDYDYLTSIAPIFAKNKKTTLVVTNDAFTGMSWNYGKAFIDFIATTYTHTIGKWVLNSYDIVVLLHSKLIEQAKELGVPQNKLHTIHNGVDLSKFNPNINGTKIRQQLKIKDNETMLLCVARLAPVKQLEILIEATKELAKLIKIKTVIIGDGPSKAEYQKLAEPIKENIIFAGPVPHSQIPNYMAASDICILTSLSEGLPTVLIEAGACGKPVVSSNVGGISDIVLHNKTGFLVNSHKPNDFVTYVKQLALDPKLRKKFSLAAYKHIKTSFDWLNIIKRYEKLYQNFAK